MTSKERATLRSIASNIDPIFQIGKGGPSETMWEGLDQALEKRELIKITVLRSCEYDPKELMEQLCEDLKAQPVCTIGSKIVIYRRSKSDNVKHIEF